MAIETFQLYALAYFLICLTPGPAVIFVTSQSAWRGRMAGFKAALGIESANIILWALSAFGLAAVIVASHALFTTVKIIGAAYLAWLGYQAISNSFKPAQPKKDEISCRQRAYVDALIVGLSNPKSMLFFIALVPQFLDPTMSANKQIIIMAFTGIAIDFSVNVIYAIVASEFGRFLSATKIKHWFDRTVGCVFLSLAAAAALYRRG